MKKILLLLSFFVLLIKTEISFSQCLTVNAGTDQSMCTGPANLTMTYTPVYATTSYTVAPITYAPASYTGGSLALATNVDDIYSGVINIGFCFQFYGNTYTQCLVGSNGLITFDLTDASAYCNWGFSSTDQLPTTVLPMNSIMGPYHDIDPSVNPSSGTSEVKYATYGSAPCRTFVVSWSNTPMYSCTSMIDNQQIILYESTNIIEVHMGNKPLCTSWNGGLAILGIQNSTGTTATTVAGKNCTQWSAANESYRFSPAGAEVTTVNWLQGATVLGSSTSTSVNPSTTTTYTAKLTTPTCAGNIVVTDDVVVTISAATTPTFAAIPNVCQNDPAPVLPTSSTNTPAITGTWSPAVSTATLGTTTYTFTPTAGQCATTATNTITVDTPVTPTFAAIANVCQGSVAPVLPTSSTNTPTITGTWLPAVSTATAGTTTYTFTPTVGQCAATATTSITVDAQITPTFSAVSDVCLNSTAPTLPTSSTNTPVITGSWSPAVSTTTAGTTTYTFTPAAGECATTATNTITVASQITPTFTQIASMCQGSVPPALPSSSTNSPAMTGVWSPTTISTATAGTATYTFTPDPGQCGGTTTMDITINAPVSSTFAAVANVCQNSIAPTLPTSSTNTPAITGTWSPAVSTATAGTITYTFTPTAGQCATTATNTITVDPQITPTFTAIPTICQNSAAPTLPTSSTNTPAIPGTWSPATINSATAGTTTYTFTPGAGQCAVTSTLSITVDPQIVPTFASIPNVCQNSTAPTLPTSSTNTPAITGTWSPAVNTALAGTITYTFTPTAGVCATTATNTITVDPQVTPLFTAVNPICAGSIAPTLQTSSINSPSITGSWMPATVSNISTGTYTFTPNTGECATTATLTVTVNPLPVLIVTDPAPVCEPLTIDLTDPAITAGSSGGTISYYSNSACTLPISSPSSIGSSGTYYIASVSSAGCITPMPVTVEVNPLPQANFTPVPQTLNAYNLTSTMQNLTVGASTYEWYFMDGAESNESDPTHTFPDSIYGDQLVILIAISPEGCRDTTEKAVTIIEELIFYVPNSFTPDGDNFNQTFQPVFTSGYDPYDFNMLIFNRWGELVFESHDASIGWDGTYGDKLVKDDVLTWKIEFKISENDKRIAATGSVTIAK